MTTVTGKVGVSSPTSAASASWRCIPDLATHTAVAVSPTGAVLDQLTVSADAKGYRRLIAFGERHNGRPWAIEGTGSFGAGLTTALLAHEERVVEVDRPQRPARRAGAKSDDIDAVRAAR